MSCNCNEEKKIKVKKLNVNAKLPTRGSASAAGYDLYANTREKLIILPHETVVIGTGLAFELPEGTFGAIYARSGLASKKGLRPANCTGVVDSDYRGQAQEISAGERIAQLILQTYIPMTFEEVDNLEQSDRGEAGFGSTGTN